MFGTNQITGRKFFVGHDHELYVTSCFATLQGEGPMSGQACVFVRLTKCNLDCKFCDTFFDSGEFYSFPQVYEMCKTALDKYGLVSNNVGMVITGGEPFLQDKALKSFLGLVQSQFAWVQIETNGLLGIADNFPIDYIVCSPKCSEVNGKYLRPHESVMEQANCLKFVLNSDPDSPYHKVPEWAVVWHELYRKPIYVSPMNIYNDLPAKAKEIRLVGKPSDLETRSTVDEVVSFWTEGLLDRASNQRNHEYAAVYAIRNNFRLTLQTHLLASLP